MTTPALQQTPRELTDVLIADRERLRRWIEHIQLASPANSKIDRMCALALAGHDLP